MKKRILVVGLGSIGRRHARLLAARPDTEVCWAEINDAVLHRATEELGQPSSVFRDFDTALASGPDAVIIATPQSEHARQACAALDSGIPVLCEKPLSDNLNDAKKIVAAVEKNQGCLTVGFQSHFSNGHRRMRDLIQSGALGMIRHFHCRVGTYITLKNSGSRYQSKVYGSLIQDYSHQLDLGYWMLRKVPCEVRAQGITTREPELWADPNVLIAQFEYEENLIGTLHLNYLQMPQSHSYEIVGDDGWILYDADSMVMKIGSRISDTLHTEHYPQERDLFYIREHEAFFNAIRGAAPVESSAYDGLVSVALADAVIRSLREGVSVAPALTDFLLPT
jgi:predicted dehydrogenase